LIHQDKKPIFYNKIKPKTLSKPEFVEVPLVIKEQIKCDRNFLFKDNSNTKIKYIDKAHGFFTNNVYALAEDRKGNISFGPGNDGLGKFNGDYIQKIGTDSTHELNNVEAIFNDFKDRVWFIEDDKLYFLKKNESIKIRGIEKDYKRNIWVSTLKEGSFCIGEDKVLQYKEGLPNKEVWSVAVEKEGKNTSKEKHTSIKMFINNNEISFLYKDNGNGFPEGFSMKDSKYLGYTLIPSFVKRQLKGLINCSTNNGAKVKITFPK
jgi:hypothetical protein